MVLYWSHGGFVGGSSFGMFSESGLSSGIYRGFMRFLALIFFMTSLKRTISGFASCKPPGENLKHWSEEL